MPINGIALGSLRVRRLALPAAEVGHYWMGQLAVP